MTNVDFVASLCVGHHVGIQSNGSSCIVQVIKRNQYGHVLVQYGHGHTRLFDKHGCDKSKWSHDYLVETNVIESYINRKNDQREYNKKCQAALEVITNNLPRNGMGSYSKVSDEAKALMIEAINQL